MNDYPKHDALYNLWKKYGGDAKYFIESGTYKGLGVHTAMHMGFERYYSVELDHSRFTSVATLFGERLGKDVFLECSLSVPWLEKLMPTIDEKCLFWLDAHNEGGGAPVLDELKIISNHHIKNHIIFIDDVPLYYGNGEALKQECLKMNPDYKFTWTPPDHLPGYPNYVLIAYTEEPEEGG